MGLKNDIIKKEQTINYENKQISERSFRTRGRNRSITRNVTTPGYAMDKISA